MHHVVANVFKAILISVLLMAFVGTAANIYMAFNTIGRIDAVAEAMKSELSRNNAFLAESFDINSTSMNYTKQLTDIMNTSFGDLEYEKEKQFVLKRVLVVPSAALNDPATKWDASNSPYVVLDTGLNGANYYNSVGEGNIIPTNLFNVHMTEAQGGNYGDFMTIVMEWDVNITIFATASMEEISSTTKPNDDDSTIAIHKGLITVPVSLKYTVPCLRYMKGGA